MEKYLVTGGAGFIGSSIVKELLERGEKVRVIDNLSTGSLSNLDGCMDQIEFIEGDITDYEMAEKAVEGITYVIHQAAIPSVKLSIENPIEVNHCIVGGTVNILDAAVKSKTVKRVVQASSSAIYGDSEVLPKKEDMLPNPISPYGSAKLTQESYASAFYRSYGLEVISLRYFNVFGENQRADTDYSAVIPKFVEAIKAGKQPIIYGDGLTCRDFIHVKNVVDANLLACHSTWNPDKAVFNIGCGTKVSLNELVQSINDIVGTSIEAIYEEERVGDIKHSVSSIDEAKEVLGYEVGIDFEQGLKRLIKYR